MNGLTNATWLVGMIGAILAIIGFGMGGTAGVVVGILGVVIVLAIMAEEGKNRGYQDGRTTSSVSVEPSTAAGGLAAAEFSAGGDFVRRIAEMSRRLFGNASDRAEHGGEDRDDVDLE